MNQPVPSDNNPSSDIEQHVNNSDVDGGIQAIHGDNNKQVQIINYYYREVTKAVTAESVDTDNENLPCPYRGLFHFGPDDAEFFFGREVFVEELFAATQTRNFIPVLGASGSGKSSVVLAGLVPRLQEEGNWLFTHFRPGSEPFHALALALVPLYTPDLNATERIAQARKLADYLRQGTIPLADVFAQIHQNHQSFRVLLIAEQFEELYTLCTDGKIRRSFLDVLLATFELSDSQSQQNNVLIATMRADFLGNALSYPKFGDLLQNSDIKIRSMNHEELQEVIIKPADKLGVSFEAGLVERILDDVEDEPGNLPLLEFALTQLWKRRTGKQLSHVAYEEIGEVKGALARHADQNYLKLNEVEREQVRQIFIQLVYPGEATEDTRRLATKEELGNDVSWELVKKLADVRLVVTSRNAADKETVEVIHEALIRNWGKFRQWMDTDRNFRVWQERLRVIIYQWEQTQRDEGALLRGALLVEAEKKLKERREELSKEEREFIQVSLALSQHNKRLIYLRNGGIVIILLVLAGMWSWLNYTASGQLTQIRWKLADVSQKINKPEHKREAALAFAADGNFAQALELAEQTQVTPIKAIILVKIAESNIKLKQTEKAGTLINKAIDNVSRVHNLDDNYFFSTNDSAVLRDKTSALTEIAKAIDKLNQEEQALTLLKKSIESSNRIRWEGEDQKRVQVLLAFAEVYSKFDWQEAKDILAKVEETAKDSDVLIQIAQTYEKLNQTEEAALLLDKAIDNTNQMNDSWSKTSILIEIVLEISQFNQVKENPALLNKAIESLERSRKDSWGKANALITIAETYDKLYPQRNTATFFYEAIDNVDKMKDYNKQRMLIKIVHTISKLNQIEELPDLLNKAIVSTDQIQKPDNKIKAFRAIAQAIDKLNQMQEASNLLEQIETRTKQIKDYEDRAYALSAIAKAYIKIDQEQCSILFNKARDNAEKIPNLYNKALALAEISKAISEFNQVEATKLLNKAIIAIAQTPDSDNQVHAIDWSLD